MDLKVRLQEKHAHLDFSDFNVTNTYEKGLIKCPKHGSYYKSYSESFRQKFCCKDCVKVAAIKPKIISKVCEVHGKYSHGRYDSPRCKKCLKSSKVYPIEKLQPIIDNMGLILASEYKGLYSHVIFDTIYGKVRVQPNSIKKLQVPSIKSAVDKTDYALKEYNLLYNNYYTYPNYKYVSSRHKFTAICPKHGEFVTDYTNHKIHRCKDCSYASLDIGFTKDDFIRIAGNRLSTLYLVELIEESESILKIGITCRGIRDRLYGHKYKIIGELKDLDAGYIYDLEKALHNKLAKFSKSPNRKFSGHTECYDINSRKEIIHEFRNIQKPAF